MQESHRGRTALGQSTRERTHFALDLPSGGKLPRACGSHLGTGLGLGLTGVGVGALKEKLLSHDESLSKREVKVKELRRYRVTANSSCPLNGAGLLGRLR